MTQPIVANSRAESVPPVKSHVRKKSTLSPLLLSISLIAGTLTSCANLSDVTGSINLPNQLPSDEQGIRAFTQAWGQRYEQNPKDKTSGMNYARGLRALTQYAQAIAVMENLAINNPKDQEILGAYGKALASGGRLQEAADVLQKAHTPDRPNWSVLSAQGSVADQLGDHLNAQQYYLAALKIVPGEPSVMSNLGLSYALSRNLKEAEAVLRNAIQSPRADSRVRQNLALVLSLEGKFDEAEIISRQDLSEADAAANIQQVRQMISQSNSWRQISQASQQD
ncbi:MAG: hypothetical protein EBY21_12475 [Alphaproteobacteria bacterium]|nr:hypothetical protein [Alphaproteobacteria bacterium]